MHAQESRPGLLWDARHFNFAQTPRLHRPSTVVVLRGNCRSAFHALRCCYSHMSRSERIFGVNEAFRSNVPEAAFKVDFGQDVSFTRGATAKTEVEYCATTSALIIPHGYDWNLQ